MVQEEMLFFYNLFQLLLLPLLVPALCVAALSPKYRGRLTGRLGIGMERTWQRLAAQRATRSPVFWVHALSVGEVVAAKPLVHALRKQAPAALILFTTTTRSGAAIAEKALTETVDLFAPFPFDLYPVVRFFFRNIQPDIYIQIETDFWPNFLHEMKRATPTRALVNGRLSQRSFQRYARWPSLSRSLFSSFSLLFMQTEKDADRMALLGVPEKRVFACGNLKYDAAIACAEKNSAPAPGLLRFFPAGTLLVIAGSTHPGEERAILAALEPMLRRGLFFLLIAPRNPARGKEVLALAESLGLPGSLRTAPAAGKKIMVLDTVGELAGLYRQCDIAIIGGSFDAAVAGHNPLEPAIHAKPVLFGPHMENFHEIAAALLEAGCAWQVADAQSLAARVRHLVDHGAARLSAGNQAARVVAENSGAAERIADAIGQTHSAVGKT